MFSTILVAADGSDHAKRALTAACDLARRYDAALHLVTTPQPDMSALAAGAALGGGVHVPEPSPETVEESAAKVVAEAEAIVAAAGGVVASTVVGRSTPARNILERADEIEADLIIMGRRGLGAFGSLLLGSTSLKVSQETHCACLTVA